MPNFLCSVEGILPTFFATVLCQYQYKVIMVSSIQSFKGYVCYHVYRKHKIE